MHQEIQLNIISFTAPVQEADFPFYTVKQVGYCPIHKGYLNGAVKRLVDESELHYENWLCTNIAQATKSEYHFPIKISLFSDKAEILDEPALIFPYFTHDKLLDHSKESLWFL